LDARRRTIDQLFPYQQPKDWLQSNASLDRVFGERMGCSPMNSAKLGSWNPKDFGRDFGQRELSSANLIGVNP
jgi:hypothetical protein